MNDLHTVTHSQLLAHMGWVRALARSLVRDEARAADVEQAVWLEALERPPATAMHLRGWLRRVASNAARQLGRSETRRSRREAIAIRERGVAPSTDELVQEGEAQRELVNAVMELDEARRELVLRHYLGGESLRSIARAQGRHPSTLHERMEGALAELRTRLDAHYGADRRSWMGAVGALGLARPRKAWTLLGWTGGLWMMGKVTVAAVAILLGSWFFLNRPDHGAAEGEGEVAVAAVPAPGALEALSVSEPEPVPEVAPRTIPVSRPEGRFFEGRVIEFFRNTDGPPVPNLKVGFYEHIGNWYVREPLAETTTDAEGRFRVQGDFATDERITVWLRGSGYVDMSTGVDEGQLLFRMRPAIDVTLRLVDATSGLPVVGARVNEQEESAPGVFLFEDQPLASEQRFTVVAPEYAVVGGRETFYERQDVSLTYALERGEELRVRVLDLASGQSVPGAFLSIDQASSALPADGQMILHLQPGTELEFMAEHPDYLTTYLERGTKELELPGECGLGLVPPGRVRGRVLDARGEGLAGVSLGIDLRRFDDGDDDSPVTEEARSAQLAMQRRATELGLSPDFELMAPFFSKSAVSDEDGSFELTAVPGRMGQVRAYRPGDVDAVSEWLVFELGGAPHEVELVLTPAASVRGRLTQNGASWSVGTVCAENAAGERVAYSRVDGEGRYELTKVTPGEAKIVVLGERRRPMGQERTIVLEAGQDLEVNFSWDTDMQTVTGRVTGNGIPLEGLEVRARKERSYTGHFTRTNTDGDGRYSLELESDQLVAIHVDWRGDSQAARAIDPGSEGVDFELHARATLRLEVTDLEGQPVRLPRRLPDSNVWMRSQGKPTWRAVRTATGEDGTLIVTGSPGERVDLDLLLIESGHGPVTLEGVLFPEVEGTWPVELPAGVPLDLRLEGDALPANTNVYLVREDRVDRNMPAHEEGKNLSTREPSSRRRLTFEEGALRVPALCAGTYVLASSSASIVFDPESIEVREGGDPIEVTWRTR